MQIVAMLGFSLDMKFPENFNETTSLMSLANVDVITVLPFGCYVRTNHHDKLMLYTLLPAFASAVLLLIFFALKRTRHKSISGGAFSAFLNMNSFILPMLTSLIFSTFPCTTFDDGSRLLMADLSIDCDSKTHQSYSDYAKAMVAVYVRARASERAKRLHPLSLTPF
jgi:hypothetical protein